MAASDRPRWSVRRLPAGARGVWAHCWLPRWHEGRGPYVSLGLWAVALYRGY